MHRSSTWIGLPKWPTIRSWWCPSRAPRFNCMINRGNVFAVPKWFCGVTSSRQTRRILLGSLTARPWKSAICTKGKERIAFQPWFLRGYVKLWGCINGRCIFWTTEMSTIRWVFWRVSWTILSSHLFHRNEHERNHSEPRIVVVKHLGQQHQ